MTNAAGSSVTAPFRHGPALLIGAALVLVFITTALVTPADADLWGHLTFGRDIVQNGHPIVADVYSFASDRTWINHEWLSEVMFHEVYDRAGSVGLIAFKLAIIALLLTMVGHYLRREGASFLSTSLLLIVVFVGSYWRTHTVRPQLFSVFFFAALMIAIRRADMGHNRALAAIPILMALWVNFHGGWIVGAGVFGLWVTVRILEPGHLTRDRALLVAVGVATVLATLATPYGVPLIQFLAETVRLERSDIEDWSPVLASPVALGIPWLAAVGAGLVAFRESNWRPNWCYGAIAVLLAAMSFRVSRLDAFFAIAVVVLFTPELIRALAQLRLPAARQQSPMPRGAVIITALVGCVTLIPVGRILAPYTTCLTMQGTWLPAPDAAEFIRVNHLQGRMLTWFDWGEYIIWHAGPGLQVSMDGRRETVYSDRTIQAHRRFYAGDDPKLSLVHELNPDYIWLPKRLPIVPQLLSAGWTAIFTGPTSVVLSESHSGPFLPISVPKVQARCFPGP